MLVNAVIQKMAVGYRLKAGWERVAMAALAASPGASAASNKGDTTLLGALPSDLVDHLLGLDSGGFSAKKRK